MSPLKVASFAAALAVLAACATPNSLTPGTTIDQARARLGNPTGSYSLPTGGTRLQYSNQPFDQSVWNADFDAQGRLAGVEQVMTDAAFARVRSGKDTRSDVLRDFGQPAETFYYKLRDEHAWMYRYYTYGGFKAAMFIYFDPAGVVKRTETGLDPWAIRDGGRND
jgi:outer membrane protein assembly factor BamE (lipoprotein component of BamABCDE complex)